MFHLQISRLYHQEFEEMLVETTRPPPQKSDIARPLASSIQLCLGNSMLLISCLTVAFDLFVDFTIREILTDPSEVQQFMQNLSIPPSVAEGLLNSTVNTREVRFL